MHTTNRIRLSVDDEHTLVHAWKAGRDPRAAQQLLAAFDRWLASLAYKSTLGRPTLFDDAMQEGRVAFLDVLYNSAFEPGWRVSISTVLPVRRAMRRVVARHTGTLDFLSKSKAFQTIHSHLARCEHRVRQEMCRSGQPFTETEVTRKAADALGVSLETIETYRTMMRSSVSKDAPVFEDSDVTFEPTCPAEQASETVAHAHDRSKIHGVLRELLPSLHPVERTIVEHRVLRSPPLDSAVLAKNLRMGPDRYTVVEQNVLAAITKVVQMELGIVPAPQEQPQPEPAPKPKSEQANGLYKPRKRRMPRAFAALA